MCRVDDDIDDDRSSTSTQDEQVLLSSQLNEALIEAVCEGSILKVQSLLDQHAHIHARTPDTRESVLHLASKHGHHQCIELLLDQHAHIHTCNQKNKQPLHLASKHGRHQCIELLLDRHADVNARTAYSITPLHLASSNGHHRCIELLLDRHADINARSRNSFTPLHEASSNGHHQCIELLLDRHADINARCCGSVTPLHEASFYGQLQCSFNKGPFYHEAILLSHPLSFLPCHRSHLSHLSSSHRSPALLLFPWPLRLAALVVSVPMPTALSASAPTTVAPCSFWKSARTKLKTSPALSTKILKSTANSTATK